MVLYACSQANPCLLVIHSKSTYGRDSKYYKPRLMRFSRFHEIIFDDSISRISFFELRIQIFAFKVKGKFLKETRQKIFNLLGRKIEFSSQVD